MTVTRSQTFIVFEKDTAESKIAYHVRRNKACAWYDGIPPKWIQRAEDEGWTLPKVIVETWDEEVTE